MNMGDLAGLIVAPSTDPRVFETVLIDAEFACLLLAVTTDGDIYHIDYYLLKG